ncbi:MAG: ABC transporter permease [Lactovum sp.]
MKNISVLLKKDLLSLWRSKKILILSIVFLLFAFSSPVLAYYMPEILKLVADDLVINSAKVTLLDSYLQFFKNLGQIGLFILIILFIPELINERKKGQLATLFNHKVTKTEFILSKLISQIIIFTFIFGLSIATFSLYNLILFEKAWLSHSFLSFSLFYLYFIFIICLCNFFSSFSRNLTLAMVLTFSIVIFMPIFHIFDFGVYLPSYLTNLSTSVLTSQFIQKSYQNIISTSISSIFLIFLAIQLCRYQEN